MRTLVIFLASSTALLGAACAYLLWFAGRDGARATGASDCATETQWSALIAERDRLRSALVRPRSDGVSERAASAAMVPLGGAAGNPALGSGRVGPGLDLIEQLGPEHQRTMQRQRYGMVFHELSLSDAEIDALLPVLASVDDQRGGLARGATQEPADAQRREQAVASVIGAEKAARFAEAERTLPARSEVRLVAMQLEQSGAPLSEEQREGLTAKMRELEPFQPPVGPDVPPHEAMVRFRAWRAERTKAIRALAAPLLSPRQLQYLEESDALQSALQAAMPPPLPAH